MQQTLPPLELPPDGLDDEGALIKMDANEPAVSYANEPAVSEEKNGFAAAFGAAG